MKRRSMTSLLLGAVVISATVLISMILHPPLGPSTIIGMCFVFYSECLFFGWIPLVDRLAQRKKTSLAWSGIGITISFYAAVVFFSAILCISGYTTHIKGFLVLQIVLFAAAASLCLVIGSFSAKVKKDSDRLRQAELGNQMLLEQLICAKEQVSDKTEINQLIEAVRYSDISVTVDADMELHRAAAGLQEFISSGMVDTPEFGAALREMKSLVNKREFQARISKSGEV